MDKSKFIQTYVLTYLSNETLTHDYLVDDVIEEANHVYEAIKKIERKDKWN